ncbi:MAG: S1 family peptidase [Candidatus Thiodiazotropha lotti]|nr:S1 family peptidase [Candidatus Thiodiazotropha lotti]
MEEHLIRDSLSLLLQGVLSTESVLQQEPEFRTDYFSKSIDSLTKKCSFWMRDSGVQGFGLGKKLTNGLYDNRIVLRTYVEKKKPLKTLKQRVPRKIDFPEIGRINTDVIEIGRLELNSLRKRVRPVTPGCSIGHITGTNGSVGCLVKIQGKSAKYLLSNAHILSDFKGVDAEDHIVQPSIADNHINTDENIVAKLQFYTSYDYSRNGYPNTVDAAIALIRSRSATNIIPILGTPLQGISTELSRDMDVKKVGRTTGLTTGIILDTDFYFRPLMPTAGRRRRRAGFSQQVLCTRFTDNGDSGSAVLNKNNELVGLHMAGSDRGSIFNKIDNVFRLFNLELAQ